MGQEALTETLATAHLADDDDDQLKTVSKVPPSPKQSVLPQNNKVVPSRLVQTSLSHPSSSWLSYKKSMSLTLYMTEEILCLGVCGDDHRPCPHQLPRGNQQI